MEIAFLLHSRTFLADFNSNFAVRPKDLDVTWARSKILPSTRDIDLLNGFRRVVAFKGNIGIAGISGNFKAFIKQYLPDVADEAQKYFREEHGRGIKVFIGYVFKGNGVPDISANKLWEMFKEHFAPQWESKSSDTKYVDYENRATKSAPAKDKFEVKPYKIGEVDEVELFEWCIAHHKDFCSNVDQFEIFRDGGFKVVIATPSVVKQINANPPAQQQTVPAQKKK